MTVENTEELADKETTTMQMFTKMTKKLITQIIEEPDLKAIDPEMVRAVKECAKAVYGVD